MEIEKKFTIKELPENLDSYKKFEIEQGYLCSKPVVRIRKKNDKYILTYKNRNGISQDVACACEEIEMELSEESFYHLKEKCDGNIIRKTRYVIPIEDNLKVELDVFHGHLEGLRFAEVEFRTEEQAKNFKLLPWFLKDVTHDKRYKNSFIKDLKDTSCYEKG